MQDLIVERILAKLLIEHHNLEEAVKKHDTKQIEETATRKEELLKQLKLLMCQQPGTSETKNSDASQAAAIESLGHLLSEQILKFDELKAKGASEEKLSKSALFIDLLLEEIALKQQLVA
jgi:predicted metal-dependent hydrolase